MNLNALLRDVWMFIQYFDKICLTTNKCILQFFLQAKYCVFWSSTTWSWAKGRHPKKTDWFQFHRYQWSYHTCRSRSSATTQLEILLNIVGLPVCWVAPLPSPPQIYKQARKARRCDSYLQSETINDSLTGVGARRCYRI